MHHSGDEWQVLQCSTLVQVMAWCLMAPSHHLNQCWPSPMTPYGITRYSESFCGVAWQAAIQSDRLPEVSGPTAPSYWWVQEGQVSCPYHRVLWLSEINPPITKKPTSCPRQSQTPWKVIGLTAITWPLHKMIHTTPLSQLSNFDGCWCPALIWHQLIFNHHNADSWLVHMRQVQV